MAVAHTLWLACSLLCAVTCGGLLLKALDERAGPQLWFAATAFVLWAAFSVVLLIWEMW